MISSTTSSTLQGPRRRRRPPRSCVECRRRKVKCDRKRPCNHCILSKTSCIYDIKPVQAPVPLAGPDPLANLAGPYATPPQPSETGPNQDRGTSHRTEPTPSSAYVSPHVVDSNGDNPSLTHPLSSALGKDVELDELNRRVRALEQLLSMCAPGLAVENYHGPGPPNISEIQDLSHLPQERRLVLNKSRLFGKSHWTNHTYEFNKITELMNSETNDSTDNEATRRLKSEIRALFQKCKLSARSRKKSRPGRCFSHPEPNLPGTSKDFADQMAQLYVSRFESAFRILHIPSFWTEYEQYWRNPTESASVLRFKIQLVIAIGSSLYRESPDTAKAHSAACQWMCAAQNWLSGPMGKDRLSISSLQVQCLLILSRHALSVSGDLIWVAMGSVVRTAMQMGLHRDPKHFTKMTILHAEIRRRLWATILEMNVQASLDAGVPPTLSFDDFDTGPPSNVDDRDIDSCTGTLEQYPKTTVTDTSSQRFLFECLRPRMEILRRMNGVESEMSHDKILTLTSEISNACRECSAYIQKGNGAEVQVFRHNLVDLLLRRFLLCLHRPFMSRARTNPLFYFSRKIGFDSAMALLTPAPNEEFSHLVLIGGGIFKNRIIHVSLALASELLIETEEQEGNPSMQVPSGYRKVLIDAVKEARWQSVQRTQLGETNVRLQMKLSLVLSQAEHTEANTSLQQRMARDAKDSLERSYSTIQASLGSPDALLHCNENTLTLQEANQPDFSFGLDFDDILQTINFAMDGTFDSGLPF